MHCNVFSYATVLTGKSGFCTSVRVIQGTNMANLKEPYQLFYRHRRLLWDAVKQSLRERHAGSVLGLAWLILGPLILLSLYALLYTVVFQVRPIGLSVTDYILYISAGLIPFIAFAQALSAGTVALSQNQALLLNRMFPAELIPAREVLVAGAFLVMGGFMILVYKLFTGYISWAWLLLPVIILSMTMATLGCVWALSLTNLFLKDVQQALQYVIIMILIASPIAYTPDMVPPALRILLYVNPFAYYVMSFQSVLVLGAPPPPGILFGCIAFAFLAFHGMFHVFSMGKRVIADQI